MLKTTKSAPRRWPVAALLVLKPLQAAAQTGNTVESPDMSSILLVPLLVAIVVFSVRALLRRKVRQTMFDTSAGQAESLPELLKTGEVSASVSPEFVVVNADSDSGTAKARRMELEKVARKDLTRAFGYELIISAAYLLTGEFFYVAMPFAFIALLRYLVFRNPSRAHTPGLAGCLGSLVRVHGLVQAAGPKGRFAWHGIVLVTAIAFAAYLMQVWAFYQEGVFLLLAACLHIILLVRLRHRASRRAGLKLLVLRVFGIADTMTFTFNGLLDYWQYFGTYFMVADPVLLRMEQGRRSILLWLLIAVIFGLSVFMADHAPVFFEMAILKQTLVAGAYALGIGYIYYLVARRKNERRFVRSREDLLGRVADLTTRPMTWNLNYRCLPMFCFANTWRMAVDECIKETDAVLMDLRGFSEARKGCEYEVDYLFDAIAVEKIVFIVDENSVDRVQELIRDKWKLLRTSSPNLANEAPRITLYQTTRQNRHDMQSILDLVLNKASAAKT